MQALISRDWRTVTYEHTCACFKEDDKVTSNAFLWVENGIYCGKCRAPCKEVFVGERAKPHPFYIKIEYATDCDCSSTVDQVRDNVGFYEQDSYGWPTCKKCKKTYVDTKQVIDSCGVEFSLSRATKVGP